MLLTATVIGSGIMAERLAGGNFAVALIAKETLIYRWSLIDQRQPHERDDEAADSDGI
jgi:hypothetical protein